MNQIRVPFIRDGLISTNKVIASNVNKPYVLKDLNILEVGCGGGILTENIANLQANVIGIDPSHELIETAKTNSKNKSATYICETIETHAENNPEKYDAVIASEVLEHVPDQKSFLNSCVASLKPGGSIFITTINKTQASFIFGIVAAEYILKLLPAGTHSWDQFISPEEVSKILKNVNCSTILVHGFRYEFWSNTFEWQDYAGINYALHAVKNVE
jgi:polyprenyldihydroxybenzoate methyltransferase / 3-demethylubiquinol 3-O-methyltransferase